MAPKKKAVEDTRSPLEIAIAGTEEQIRVCEHQVQQYRDGVQDLAIHTQRIKQCEGEVVPREAELKTILNNFNKLLENSVAIARMRSGPEHVDAPTSPGSRQPSRAASRAGAATPLPPAVPGPEEAVDKDLMKTYMNVMREQLTSVLVPLFQHERTSLEHQIEEAKEREVVEAHAAAVAAAQAAAAGGAAGIGGPAAAAAAPPPAAKPPAAAAKPGAPAAAGAAAGAPGKAGAADKVGVQLSSAELLARVDLELYRPPGLDPHLTQDILKLRTQRLAAERQLKTLQHQLQQSRQLVARRTNEGASKPALKKAEKTLAALQSTLRDLKRQRDETDARKRSETPLQSSVMGKGGAPAKPTAPSPAPKAK